MFIFRLIFWPIRLLIKFVVGLIILGLIIAVYISFKTPEQNRNWTEDAKILPGIILNGSILAVKNLRDWRYEKDTKVLSKDYYDETFDLEKLENSYFLINPFGKWEGVGHTFFMFEFSDGKTVSVSVEAHREDGVPYSAVKGLFNNYEMWYAWGSGADFFSRRAVYYSEDLYMYPLEISTTTAKGLLIDLAKTTESLETKPEFYNTVFSNCTNVLADSANRVNKGSIPWNYARIFTGYADNKLYELKLIPHDKPFTEIEKEARIDPKIIEIFKDNPKMSKEDFWQKLRDRI